MSLTITQKTIGEHHTKFRSVWLALNTEANRAITRIDAGNVTWQSIIDLKATLSGQYAQLPQLSNFSAAIIARMVAYDAEHVFTPSVDFEADYTSIRTATAQAGIAAVNAIPASGGYLQTASYDGQYNEVQRVAGAGELDSLRSTLVTLEAATQ